MKDMQQPDMLRKYEEGPVAIVTVIPKGPVRMGKHLSQWFLFSAGIAIFVACLTGRVLPSFIPLRIRPRSHMPTWSAGMLAILHTAGLGK